MESLPCTLASSLERIIFRYRDITSEIPDDIKNENCPICIGKLGEKPLFKHCCGGYAKQLRKCGHWVHVSCQIDNNKLNRHTCSICRNVIAEM